MKILLFSDLHAHLFKPYATILPDGMNSRLADAVSCVKQILTYIDNHPDIDLVLFGGDLFHTRGRIAVHAFNAMYEMLSKFNVPVVLIHGNHDQADKEGSVYSVMSLETICTVVSQPGWCVVESQRKEPINLMAVPYTEDIAHLREVVKQPPPRSGFKMFLGHLGLQGALVGADFVYANRNDAQVSDLNVTAFDAGYLGHFHKHQQVSDHFYYIGAPLQHTWGDAGDAERGFIVYDTNTRSHVRVLLKAPRFMRTRESDFYGLDDDYVRMTATRTYSDDEIESLRTKHNLRSLEVEFAEIAVPVQGPRIAIEHGMSYQDMVQRWVASGTQGTDGLDTDYLVQLGLEILQEVEDT